MNLGEYLGESVSVTSFGPVAQRLEQGTHNPLVVGSNPTGPTILKVIKFDKIFFLLIRIFWNTERFKSLSSGDATFDKNYLLPVFFDCLRLI